MQQPNPNDVGRSGEVHNVFNPLLHSSVPGPSVAGPAVPARRHPLQPAGRARLHPRHQLLAGHQGRPAHVHLYLHRESANALHP